MADSERARKLGSSKRGRDPAMIGHWKIGRTIGKGSSGRVKIARHTKTGQYAAIKIVSKHALLTSRLSMADAAETAEKVLLGIEREIVIMKLIDHPNILKLYDVWETSGELYLVMEYVAGGELFEYLVKRGRLDNREALKYFQQIIFAVDYCHRFNIAHRDLKPENLLLDDEHNIKVADFGMAAWEGGVGMLETSCGSPHYASPEVVEGRQYHGSTSDIWSCGVILYALLAGRLPFDDSNMVKLLEKVKSAKFTMPTDIPPAATDLLARMLRKDVSKRITMDQIKRHPFFTSHRPTIPNGISNPLTLEDVERPVNSREEIEADIFSNLRTLWHGASDDEIVEGLTNDKKTWEKAVYHLLLRYRARQLENYNVDHDDDTTGDRRNAPSQPSARTEAPTTPVAAHKPAHIVVEQLRVKSRPQSTSSTATGHHSLPPERPDPPTPRKALHGIAEDSPAVVSRKESAANLTRPVAPPLSSSQWATAVTPSPMLVDLPQTLVSKPPTPVKVITPAITPAVAQAVEVVRTPPAVTATAATTSPATLEDAPQLQVPEVEDEKVQRFFHQIMVHINTMQARQSVLVPTGIQQAIASAISPSQPVFPVSTSVPPSTPVEPTLPGTPRIPQKGGDTSQFADADDDTTSSVTGATSAHGEAKTRISAVSSRASVIPVRGVPLRATREAPPRPATRSRRNTAAEKENATSGRLSVFGPRPMSVQPRPSAGIGSDNQANVTSSRGTTPTSGKEAVFERRKTGGSKRVQIVLPPEPVRTLKKKKSFATEVSPVVPNASVFAGSDSGPKGSWFSSLFNFKPAAYQLLSVYDAAITRQECARMLASFGVSVSEGRSGFLVCRMDEIRDPTGLLVVAKAVRFRVEPHVVGLHTAHALAGYVTNMTMVQEKGALSSFKYVYNRLRREWELDGAPRSPNGTTPDTPAISFQHVQFA